MKLTLEQLQVVRHPLGQHARVLAVAGSGKSTTMAHRIKHLVLEHHVKPNAIQVLMFNALARKQFTKHLNLPETRQPIVHTFHSFSFRLINEMVKESVIPLNTKFWLAGKTELIWLTVKRAITNLEKAKRIPPESVDPEDALNTIGLWKGSLIPPGRAGSFTSAYLPLVYKEFERLRLEKAALTFNDFVPLAIDILENNPRVYERWCRELRHLIIDEYQDINFGQQRLIELLAGDRADLMVVGDDDQTIYEFPIIHKLE
jgi:DNA helicase-2/ATP-dependent DNA helicase PcrA